MAGLAGWWAGRDGGLVGPKGMDLQSKECCGVNKVTYNIQPLTLNIRLYLEKVHFYIG